MISIKGLVYGDEKTAELCVSDGDRVQACEFSEDVPDCLREVLPEIQNLLELPENRKPYSLQLFGSDAEFTAKAVAKLFADGYNPESIDINMGCPVPKVVNTGAGSALMKTPELAAEIVKAAVREASVPVTVKIRSGFDQQHINAVDFAKRLEDSGTSLITVHGRTRVDLYTGKSNPEIIRQVKAAVKNPVIANGDIVSPESAAEILSFTGCDGIMIGRGSYGKPWIFSQIHSHIAGKNPPPPPTANEQKQIMLCQTAIAVCIKGERTAMREARTQCALYLKGFPGAADFRRKCAELTELEGLAELLGGGDALGETL
jgi:nifR3 family TIM-barrel protein